MLTPDPHNKDPHGVLFSRFSDLFYRNIHSQIDSSPNGNLHHYTTSSGLIGIIQKQGFYASPFNSLNDPKELNYGVELIEQACIELTFDQSATNEERTIALAVMNNDFVKAKKYPHHFPTIILTSFSEDPDNLSQWRSYSDDGFGFSISIDPKAIDFKTQEFETMHSSWSFYKCIYDENIQKQLIRNYILLLSKNITNLKSYGDEVLGNYFLIILWELVSIFKHPAYKDEKEWRVRTSIEPNRIKNELNYYPSGKILKASKLFSFERRNLLSHITVGPRNIPESTILATEILIEQSNLNNKKYISVNMSKAPYR